MNSLYLKLLNDFCHSGNVPSVPSDAIEGKPWVIKKDPLMDFLLKLMGEGKYIKMIQNSRLSAKIFYSAVGKFIAECTHYEDFQNQRAWTERNNMIKVLKWSEAKRKDEHELKNLVDDISAKHSGFGFDKDFILRMLSGDGCNDNANWEKLVNEWQLTLDRHIESESKEHIIKRKDDFKKGLDIVMRQVGTYMKSHNIIEQQAIQAWDMMDGQWTETEFERRLNVVKVQDKYPEIKEIAACMGRTADSNGHDRLTISSGTAMKMEHSSGSDIEGITVGNDLNSLLPLELAQYCDDAMGDMFIYKFLTKRLQTFRYKSEMSKPSRKLGFTHASRRGPMIICLDTSASMYGTPQRIMASLLALLEDTAEELRRDCFLIDFSVSIRPIDLMARRQRKRMMDLGFKDSNDDNFAKGQLPFIGGGTSARKLLDATFNLLDDEQSHYVNADVLLVSDFLIPMVGNEYINKLKNYRQTGTKLYGLSIKSADDKELNLWERMFDKIYDIRYRQLRKY